MSATTQQGTNDVGARSDRSQRVKDVAKRHAGGRIVSCLEGGYNLDALARPDAIANPVGLALPFVEVVLGVLLVLGLFTRIAAAVGTVLMVAFIIGIAQAWARGLTIDCGCFGGGGQIGVNDTKYPQEIARDASFALAGAWLWWRPQSLGSLDRLLFGH